MELENDQVEDFIQDASFQQYCWGVDADAQRFWEEWLAAHPQQAAAADQAREFLLLLRMQPIRLPEREYAQERARLTAALAQKGKKVGVFEWMGWANIGKIAASIVLVAGLSWYGYDRWLLVPTDAPVSQTVAPWVEKTVPNGQKSTITLPDGSRVKINAGSSLSVSPDFGAGERRVRLEGEAFFDVAKNPQSPFTIESGNMTTTVLGTSFNVRAYKDGGSAKVAVLTGMVRVVAAQGSRVDTLQLQPNEMAVLQQSKKLIKQHYSAELELGWTEGILVFEETSMPRVVETLARWYGVDIEIKNVDLKKKSYTGKFKNESLENVLKGMGYALDFEYAINQKKVIIY